eukprot:425044_1
MGATLLTNTGVECIEQLIHDGFANFLTHPIEKCYQLTKLIQVMKTYDKYKQQSNNVEINAINMTETLDMYLHLLYQHNEDEEFEYIANVLSYCNAINCPVMNRLYRDRGNDDNKQNYNSNVEILDIIHCYFTHSYHMGYRLNKNDREIIENEEMKLQEIKSNKSNEFDLINSKLSHIKQIIAHKRKLCEPIVDCINHRTRIKCEQRKIFHFGYEFQYGYPAEFYYNGYKGNAVHLSAKYLSLKDELINNKLSVLNVSQFNNEYAKASIRLNSYHCKKYYPSHSIYHLKWITTHFSIQHILSLMVYCNFTDLQYEFTKTYRIGGNKCENTIYDRKIPLKNTIIKDNNHSEFYHLGRNLNIAICLFGTKIRDGNITKFYHGCSEMLCFNRIVDIWNGIHIKCPFSTIAAIEVAISFATNKGMVIEFSNSHQSQNLDTKYLSVEWLSDFANEKEYLFLNKGRLEITNITDIEYTYEYLLILQALKQINRLIHCVSHPLYDNIHIEPITEELILRIFQHQFSKSHPLYKEFRSLTSYGREMLSRYFNDSKRFKVQISYEMLKNANLQLLFDVLCHSNYEWVKLDNLVQLFPFSDQFDVKDIDLNDFMFEDMLTQLSTEHIKSRVREISIQRTVQDNVLWAVNKYKFDFIQIGYEMEYIKLKKADIHSGKYLYKIKRSANNA